VSFLRSSCVYAMLVALKLLSRVFYRHEFRWLGAPSADPWGNVRLVAFLNHTSLFEPVFLGIVPYRFLWRIAAHGVIPAADKTTDRPLVGLLYKFVAHKVIPITRERDETWFHVLRQIDPDSLVVMAPEGRMKRANGLDLHGKPLNVRGGIADTLLAIREGRFLIAYSGGLHHVQVPGHWPRLFKTVRIAAENVDMDGYVEEMMAKGGPDQFKRNVMQDLDARRDRNCPEEHAAKVA
jgi:acyltransferase-like protein